MLVFLPARYSCSNKFNLSQSLLGLEDKNLVFYSFRFSDFGSQEDFPLSDPAMIAGDLSSLICDLSLPLLLPKTFSSQYISFASSNISFLSGKFARSAL